MKMKSADLREKLKALHARMGDFWWYSLLLFCACRFADVLNAFVGLWLVPKYVTKFLTAHNIYSLETMLRWITAINGLKAVSCII